MSILFLFDRSVYHVSKMNTEPKIIAALPITTAPHVINLCLSSVSDSELLLLGLRIVLVVGSSLPISKRIF